MSNDSNVTATDNVIDLDTLATVTGGADAAAGQTQCKDGGCIPSPFPRPNPFPSPFPSPFPRPRPPFGPLDNQ